MSELPETPPKRMTMLSVKARDFVRFLDDVGVGEDLCSICGHTEWTVICPSGDEPTFRLGTSIRNSKEMFYFSAFGYYCEKCGYLRQHAASVVYKWVSENPEEAQPLVDSETDDISEQPADE